MRLRQLEYLLAVADNGSFTRAAEELQVSQPTLSQQIAQLERILGFALFYRTSRLVSPTDAGVAYIRCARRVFLELASGEQALRDATNLSHGALRLVMTPSLVPRLVGRYIGQYAARYPGIRLEVLELSVAEIESRLLDASADVAVSFSAVAHPDIESLKLSSSPLSLVVGQGHSLYGSLVPLTPEDLGELNFAFLTNDFPSRISIDRYLKECNITPKLNVEVNSVSVLLDIVRQSACATFLPASVGLRDHALCSLLLGKALSPIEAFLLRRRGTSHPTSIAFMDMVIRGA